MTACLTKLGDSGTPVVQAKRKLHRSTAATTASDFAIPIDKLVKVLAQTLQTLLELLTVPDSDST